MNNLIGKRFTVHGLTYMVVRSTNDDDTEFEVSPVSNPVNRQKLSRKTIENLIYKEQSSKMSILDKINMSNTGCRTMSSTILLELTEEEYEFVRTWVELGMKYEELKSKNTGGNIAYERV